MNLRLLFSATAALALAGCAAAPQTAAPPPKAQAYEQGMVSAADPRAAEAGAQMLRQGGSATDAAIATMLALTVVEPQSSGIGGGGLYVATNTRGQVETIDGRETAPAAAHPQWFFKNGVLLKFQEAVPGGTSIGVPGNLALAAKAHAAHGRLPWAVLFGPAIKLASEGFAITPRLNAMLKSNARTAGFTAEGRALFFAADGQPLPVGTVVRNEALAASLESFAVQGARAFYSGANARAIVNTVTLAPVNPAPMTEADIAAYAAKDRAPVCGTYRGYRICSMGPPSSGATTLLATLIQLVAGGTLLGLVIVGVGGNWVIRRNLAPLVRVADTARKVSALKLDTGEVALPARVADRDTDPHTEVGQVGLALNRMLDNVEGALQTRHESEMRVRQFVADASHELRTPLASIRGYAELSRRETDPVPANVSHAIGRVESEALRMQGLVEDLLLLARLDSGRPLEREPVDVTLLAMDVVSDAHAAAPDHRWELDLPDEPVEAPGDRARLHQVLANLLANARTHTPAGTTVVTRIRREGQHVRIDVADNGPGIPADLQPRVFERFTRGDDSRNRASGSTGLGLSIVAAVAGAHAGRVDLASEPGRTVFTVWLPSDGPHSSNPIPQTQ